MKSPKSVKWKETAGHGERERLSPTQNTCGSSLIPTHSTHPHLLWLHHSNAWINNAKKKQKKLVGVGTTVVLIHDCTRAVLQFFVCSFGLVSCCRWKLLDTKWVTKLHQKWRLSFGLWSVDYWRLLYDRRLKLHYQKNQIYPTRSSVKLYFLLQLNVRILNYNCLILTKNKHLCLCLYKMSSSETLLSSPLPFLPLLVPSHSPTTVIMRCHSSKLVLLNYTPCLNMEQILLFWSHPAPRGSGRLHHPLILTASGAAATLPGWFIPLGGDAVDPSRCRGTIRWPPADWSYGC